MTFFLCQIKKAFRYDEGNCISPASVSEFLTVFHVIQHHRIVNGLRNVLILGKTVYSVHRNYLWVSPVVADGVLPHAFMGEFEQTQLVD